jgi:hypothetical protein
MIPARATSATLPNGGFVATEIPCPERGGEVVAGVRIEFAPDWLEQLRAAEAVMLDINFGPPILADMQRGTPVLTDRLRSSEDFQVVEFPDAPPELQIGSFPDDEGPVDYAAAVEKGFDGEVEVREHERRGPDGQPHIVREHTAHMRTPEQPYMRPALWVER